MCVFYKALKIYVLNQGAQLKLLDGPLTIFTHQHRATASGTHKQLTDDCS